MKIGKSIIAVILASFTGVALNPEVLTALDMAEFSDIDTSRMSQTVLRPVVLPDMVKAVDVPVVSTYAFTEVVEPVAVAAETVSLAPVVAEVEAEAPKADSIEVAGKEIALGGTHSLAEDAGTKVKAWYYAESGKFIYAHNLDTVFGGLKNLKTGDTFTVNYAGKVHNYKIADVIIYDYDGNILTLNGGGNYMQYVKLGKSSKSVAYDMALMTCHGANDSQRLVVFANEI